MAFKNCCGGGGIDTSDANAIASDIMPGKTAYVNDVKLTGTATNDATATAAKILAGFTAYVNGVKITGSASNFVMGTFSVGGSDISSKILTDLIGKSNFLIFISPESTDASNTTSQHVISILYTAVTKKLLTINGLSNGTMTIEDFSGFNSTTGTISPVGGSYTRYFRALKAYRYVAW